MNLITRLYRRLVSCRCPGCRASRAMLEMDALHLARACLHGGGLLAVRLGKPLVTSMGDLPDGQRIAILVGVGPHAANVVEAGNIIGAAIDDAVEAAGMN